MRKTYIFLGFILFSSVFMISGCKEAALSDKNDAVVEYNPESANAELISAIDISEYFIEPWYTYRSLARQTRMDLYQGQYYLSKSNSLIIVDATNGTKTGGFQYDLAAFFPEIDSSSVSCSGLAVFSNRVFAAFRCQSTNSSTNHVLFLQSGLDGSDMQTVDVGISFDLAKPLLMGYNRGSGQVWIDEDLFTYNAESNTFVHAGQMNFFPLYEPELMASSISINGTVIWRGVDAFYMRKGLLEKYSTMSNSSALHIIYADFLGTTSSPMIPHDIVINDDGTIVFAALKDYGMHLLKIRPLE